MKKILHILKSTKRDLNIVNLYDSLEELQNLFFFDEKFAKQKNSKEDYELLKNKPNVYFYTKQLYPNIKEKSFDFIFVYALNKDQIKICFKFLESNTKLVWVSLGGEIYSNAFMSRDRIYQPETLKVLKNLDIIKNLKISLIYSFFSKFSLTNKFFKRVNYVSPRLVNEMKIINDFKYISAEYVRIPLGDNVSKNKNVVNIIDSDASDIYVGPSASPTSNHLDVFKKISELDLNHKVHVTLSYKINKEYQKAVIHKGEQLFKENFKPQTEFFTKEEFEKMLNTCNIAIFNNERQEGLLTIAICAEKGMKVFLSEKSPSFEYLKQMGYNIFSFQNEFNIKTIDSDKTSVPIKVNKESIFLFDEVKAVREAIKRMN